MKNYFKTALGSFHSSGIYKKAKTNSANGGIKFVIKSSALLGLILGIIALVAFLIFSSTLKKMVLSFVDKSYPADLVVTVVNGNLTANTNGPIAIPLPVEKQNSKVPRNLVVLVPNEVADISVLSKYDTAAAVTSNGIVAIKDSKDSGQIQIYTYKNANKVFDKNSIIENSIKILHFVKIFVAICIIPMVVILFLVTAFVSMIYLFFIALLIYIVMRIRKLDITYKQSYKMGLYALVPMLVFKIVLFPFGLSGIFFSSVVVLAVILYATRTWKKEVPVPKIVDETIKSDSEEKPVE